MTTSDIKEKVISFVHTKDAKGEWILPWNHRADCHICDQLTEFIEGLFKEQDKEAFKIMEEALQWELSGATNTRK